jgi:hypothetical protein
MKEQPRPLKIVLMFVLFHETLAQVNLSQKISRKKGKLVEV